MQRIVPHIWFDNQAEEATEFYSNVFDDCRVLRVSHYPNVGQETHGQEAGAVMNVEFEISGFTFLCINAGPVFTTNPSISFFLNFDPSVFDDARASLDRHWEVLSDGGLALMELGEYPFSSHYGWVQDRFGVSWQLMLTDPAGEPRPFVVPELMYSGDNVNRAREAIDLYTSMFDNSQVGNLMTYPEPTGEVAAGGLAFGDFQLDGVWFAAMDSPVRHNFDFNEGISLLVNCETQEVIDHFWQMSAVPEAEQCGWIKDRFGVSWQIAPADVMEWMGSGDKERNERNFAAMMQMKKIDLSKFE